jgi:putative ABC transport system permease protein
MSLYSEVRERLRGLVYRSREELEMEEELRFHLEVETEENMRSGMLPEEARRRARVAFGGVERHKEEVREARGFGWMEILARDIGYAVRGLRLHPVFAGTLVLTLALGLGAALTMFAI